jgi:hypothetical protein
LDNKENHVYRRRARRSTNKEVNLSRHENIEKRNNSKKPWQNGSAHAVVDLDKKLERYREN